MLVAYSVMLAAAWLWVGLRPGPGLLCSADSFFGAPLPVPLIHVLGALAGATAGLGVAAASSWASRKLASARRLEEAFARLLGPLDPFEVSSLALFSSVAEEALFRGALQPAIGLVATSLLFGLLHVGPSRIFAAWTAMAVAMGFALGALALSGTLLAPILCHGLVNLLNLRRIAALAHEPP